jgi:hypothetical protein
MMRGVNIQALLAAAQSAVEEEQAPELPIEGLIARLRDDCARLDVRHRFKRGDLVRAKPGLSVLAGGNMQALLFRRWLLWPRRADPCLRSIGWCEPYDCIVAHLDSERDTLVEFATTSRRLEPFKEDGKP